MASESLSRRRLLKQGLRSASTLAGSSLVVGAAVSRRRVQAASAENQALIAITFDLEMSRNFPAWEQTHWDYEKGNLDDATKRYAVEAAKRVRARGGKMHFFVVGQVLEQENVDWLRELIDEGHTIGNHTYDHVNVLATRPEDIQFRFQRAPWLIAGRTPAQVIADNIRQTSLALEARVGIQPVGFRTPGGFSNGLKDRPDVQAMLQAQGYRWVSSLYPSHPMTPPMVEPDEKVLEGIVAAQAQAQPFVYPTGLIEVPMSPVSDIGAFRNGRWQLPSFLTAIRKAVEWTIEHGATFDFLAHPSCLVATDPKFQAVELICDLVQQAGPKAKIVDLTEFASRATPASA